MCKSHPPTMMGGMNRINPPGRPVLRTAVCALALLLGVVTTLPAFNPTLADEARSLLRDGDAYAAALLQDGTLHPVRNGRVTLDPAPFVVVVVMPQPDGLLVNASPDPDFYDGIRSNRSLPEILDEPAMFMGMAEYFFNEERTLYVSRVSPHYFFFHSFDQHRYDLVQLTRDVVIGYRSVEFLSDSDAGADPVAVGEWEGPLYLSFYYTLFRDDGSREEIQRSSTEIRFGG